MAKKIANCKWTSFAISIFVITEEMASGAMALVEKGASSYFTQWIHSLLRAFIYTVNVYRYKTIKANGKSSLILFPGKSFSRYRYIGKLKSRGLILHVTSSKNLLCLCLSKL